METKKFVEAVFTIGDNSGYKLYEWFKLFFEEREKAIREYIYLKAYLAEEAYSEAGHKKGLEEMNTLYLALGERFVQESPNYGCTYEGLCSALVYYQKAEGKNLAQMFCTRSGIGESVYSRQFVQAVPELISRTKADLWKAFKQQEDR